MQLKDKIKLDANSALRERNQRKTDALRYLISLIDKKELQLPPGGMNEAEELKVLQKELKNKQEAKEMFQKAGRAELVEQLDFEMGLLEGYLPKAMTSQELEKIVEEAVKKVGTNFGLVMREVVVAVSGRVDGTEISRVVKEKMANM